MHTKRHKKIGIKIRSRIPFPPTRVFADRKKEQKRRACRGKQNQFSPFLFFISMLQNENVLPSDGFKQY